MEQETRKEEKNSITTQELKDGLKSKDFKGSKKATYFLATMFCIMFMGGILSYFDKYNDHLINSILFCGLGFGLKQNVQDISQIAAIAISFLKGDKK